MVTTLQEELTIEALNIRKAALRFSAINHKLRQQILALLHKSQRLDVTSLYNTLGIEQSVASQHLAILRSADLVTTERDRRNIFYAVNYQALVELGTNAEQLLTPLSFK